MILSFAGYSLFFLLHLLSSAPQDSRTHSICTRRSPLISCCDIPQIKPRPTACVQLQALANNNRFSHSAFLLPDAGANFTARSRKTATSPAASRTTAEEAAPTERAAATPAAAEKEAEGSAEKPLSLLERVQQQQDAAAAEQLLRQWEAQRDALLLTSWSEWAAAVGVSVQQLQQVVLLVHSRSTSPPAKERRSRQKPAGPKPDSASRASDPASAAAAATRETAGNRSGSAISCAGGVLSAGAYELLVSLVHAEAALLLKGPQSSSLLHLQRPPSVQEWAAGAAADTAAAAAAARAVAAVQHSQLAAAKPTAAEAAAAKSVGAFSHEAVRLQAAGCTQRAALFEQLRALHLLLSWQQQQLAAAAAGVVRKFQKTAAGRQEQRLAAAEGADAGTARAAAAAAAAAATAGLSEDDLLLVALQQAREGLKRHAIDSLQTLHLAGAAEAADRPGSSSGSSRDAHEGNSSSKTISSHSKSSSDADEGNSGSQTTTASISNSSSSRSRRQPSAAAPAWVTYWSWLQQGMTRWSRMQRVPFDIPEGWWATAAAVRRVRQQQQLDELLLEQQQQQQEGEDGQAFEPLTLEEKTLKECSALSISPQRLRAVQMVTKKPISTEAESSSSIASVAEASGERKDRVGELLEADESAKQREEQHQRMHAAAQEIWQFAAAHLEPEQLHALQAAAESPFSAAQLQPREPLLQTAVQRLREAELQRLLLQLPEDQRAAAAADSETRQQLLGERSHLLQVVRDACAD
ncbi:hypothetical protein Efla_006699 [Eimeria flavescens]